jgi:hypothetical protein
LSVPLNTGNLDSEHISAHECVQMEFVYSNESTWGSFPRHIRDAPAR